MIKLLFLMTGLVFFLASCNQSTATDKKEDSTEAKEEPKKEAEADKGTKLKFVDFAFGDAEHYMFEDEKGKSYEFGKNEDKSIDFIAELSEKETTSENQGFGPDKKLLGKWFYIKFETKRMPQYQDGPEADVMVITSAKTVE
jgi:hypothetical protein